MATSRTALSHISRWGQRSLMGLGLLTLLPMVLALGLWLFSGPSVPPNSILHVRLDGALREGPQGQLAALYHTHGHPSVSELTHKIRAAATDKRIAGLFLEVKEPEVGLAQLEELARATAEFAQSGKPSWSYLETAGEGSRGDGAFALASLANTVVLAPAGEISLYGMRTDTPFAKGALDALHVDVHVEQRCEYKTFAETFQAHEFSAPHRESMVSLLTDLQQTYLDLVGAHRHRDASVVRQWVLDAPHSSSEARTAGLVDVVGYRDEAVAQLAKVAGRKEPLVDVGSYEAPRRKQSKLRVAFVAAQGEIGRGEGSRSPLGELDAIGSDTYVEALQQAREEHVDAMLVRIDSPGGSYLASDLIRREILLAREQNIFVVVSMGDVAASGGYYIASAADHIVAEAGTITGSIGVVGVMFGLRRALHDLAHVEFGTLEVLPHAGVLGFLDPPNAAQKAVLGRNIDRVYDEFVNKVASDRKRPVEEIRQVARGRVWTGRQALARGLVDELGGMDTALTRLRERFEVGQEQDLSLSVYPEPTSPWDVLRDALLGQVRVATLLHDEKGAWQALMRSFARAATLPQSQGAAQAKASLPSTGRGL